jgi:uncharacterized membrane protein YesL
MFQRRDFVKKHCLFLSFVMIICMLGHEYINGIELEGVFKTLLINKFNQIICCILLSFIVLFSIFSSLFSIIKDYKKQNIN